MSSLKKSLVIGFLILGVAVLFTRIYFLPGRAEKPADPATAPPQQQQQAAAENQTPPDRRFDGAERDRRLQAETDALLPLFDRMPAVPVYLKDEPVLKTGTNTERGAAYTHCDDGSLPVIFFKKSFYQKANRKQLVNALKHELTHAWLCRRGLMSAGHGELFRRKFTEVGGFGN